MSRPRGAPTSFGLRGGGRGAGHIGKLRGQRRQDKLPNRLQWRRVGAGGVTAKWSPCPSHPHAHTAARSAKPFKQDPKQDQRERAGEGRVCHKRKQVTHEKTDNTKQKNMQLARAQHQSSSQEGAHKGGLCARQGGGLLLSLWRPCFPPRALWLGSFLFPCNLRLRLGSHSPEDC